MDETRDSRVAYEVSEPSVHGLSTHWCLGAKGAGGAKHGGSLDVVARLFAPRMHSITKGGIAIFTKCLAKQMATRGTRVDGVAPGPFGLHCRCRADKRRTTW